MGSKPIVNERLPFYSGPLLAEEHQAVVNKPAGNYEINGRNQDPRRATLARSNPFGRDMREEWHTEH
jgi:hypothetical protein